VVPTSIITKRLEKVTEMCVFLEVKWTTNYQNRQSTLFPASSTHELTNVVRRKPSLATIV
jgi:hypothetical protein